MRIRINNLDLLECNFDNLKSLVNNPDYKESQYLEYKEIISFYKSDKDDKTKYITEYRNDICSFANAEGGYIIFGIKEKHGIPTELIGIEVADLDKLEMELRNRLEVIQPKAPRILIHSVSLDAYRFIIIIYIHHDYYAPYLHIEDEKWYRIYKRNGNEKCIIRYSELKNMFIQSHSLEKDIRKFRLERITFHESIIDQLLVFHIIPESFLNVRRVLFLVEKQTNTSYRGVFSGTHLDSLSLPCVDGIRYVDTRGDEKGYLFNNGIAEFVLPLKLYIDKIFDFECVWKYIEDIVSGYHSKMISIFGKQRYFGCISIIGCKEVVTEENGCGRHETKIDRNNIFCDPVVFSDMTNQNIYYSDLRMLHLEYLFALGIRKDKTVNELIQELSKAKSLS